MTAQELPAPLEPAALEDVEAISVLSQRAYEAYIPVINARPLPMDADYADFVKNHEAWVLRQEGTITACAVLEIQSDHLMIYNLAIDPDCQGNGWGRHLLRFGIDRALALGFKEVRLYTNALMTANREWYRRAGFTETHQVQVGDKLVVYMSMALDGGINPLA